MNTWDFSENQPPPVCKECGGEGEIKMQLYPLLEIPFMGVYEIPDSQWVVCPRCNGSGHAPPVLEEDA